MILLNPPLLLENFAFSIHLSELQTGSVMLPCDVPYKSQGINDISE